MAYRELQLTLQSARDLKNVNLLASMDVYAVASISGDPRTRQRTPPDPSGGRHPCWNATLRFAVPPNTAVAGGGWLHVLLRAERFLGDRDVGEVVVPLADLLADHPGPQPPRLASYQVHTVPRGEPHGMLNVSYRLGPVVVPVETLERDKPPHAMGYPSPPQLPFQPQNNAYAVLPQPFRPQHDAYPLPPQHAAADYSVGKNHSTHKTQQMETQVGEYAPTTQSNIHPANGDSRAKPFQRKDRALEAYAPNRPNITQGKADQSRHKAFMQQERMPSLPTTTAS